MRCGATLCNSAPAISVSVLLLAAWSTVPAQAAAVLDGTVLDLDAANFGAVVKEHPLTFVEFFAPWCGHCKKLAPEWEKVAEQAAQIGIPVAKVDAIQEKALAKAHDVSSFPTLRLYRGDPKVSKLHKGPRTADKMTEWLGTWKGATLVEKLPGNDAGAIRTWAKRKTLAIVGFGTGSDQGDAPMVAALEAASFQLNGARPGSDVPVAMVTAGSEKLLIDLGMPGSRAPSIALFRDFDYEDRWLVYPAKSVTAEGFMTWFNARRVPALIPASADTEHFFLQDIDPGQGLVILFGGDESVRRGLHELAAQYTNQEPRLKWVHATQNEFGISLAKTTRLAKEDFPEVVLWEFGETEDQDKFFRLSQQGSGAGLTKRATQDFVQRWQQGGLSAEEDPVLTVTSDTFEDVVVRGDKDVLVEFYAPWCGHCKALAPEYRQLAQHYAKDDGVAIVKMDSTKHSHPSAEVKSYPTLKFYKKGAKESPVDFGFKAGRDKQSLVDLVEEHRATPKKGKGGKKKKKTEPPAPTPAPTPGTAQAIPGSPSPTSTGVWIFDDAMDPQSRGAELSNDMVNSRNGYMLVQVGRLGLLLMPGEQGEARSVRHFSDKAEMRRYLDSSPASAAVAAAAGAATAVLQPHALPCPDDADTPACQAWCKGVSPDPAKPLMGQLAGTRCANRTGTDADKPLSCMCRPSKVPELHAMCKPRCTAVGSDKVCLAGDRSCAAPGAATGRFFLYDTKYGEGFNLQREVYPRAGWIVAQLNKAVEEKCGSADTTSPACRRWTLVLPPWCRLVHWWSSAEQLPWSTFFDAEALKKADIPVMEFHEYVALQGSAQNVDLAVTYVTDKGMRREGAKVSGGGRGRFEGWTTNVEDCSKQEVPKYKDVQGGKSLVYAGHCSGDIFAKDYRCAVLDGPWPDGIVDMLSSLPSSTTSVLAKNYDYLLAPDTKELDDLGLRVSMLFAQEIRQRGDAFIAAPAALGGRPFVSAHCRRTDFLRARKQTTPEPGTYADKLNMVLAETGISQVFIATDAPDELREVLLSQVKGRVVFYDTASGGVKLDHPGKQAAVEMWIASRADHFVGSQESRFTMAIQLERGFLGKSKASSEQEFCKEYADAHQKCVAPSYRHPSRLGAHREAYHR